MHSWAEGSHCCLTPRMSLAGLLVGPRVSLFHVCMFQVLQFYPSVPKYAYLGWSETLDFPQVWVWEWMCVCQHRYQKTLEAELRHKAGTVINGYHGLYTVKESSPSFDGTIYNFTSSNWGCTVLIRSCSSADGRVRWVNSTVHHCEDQ